MANWTDFLEQGKTNSIDKSSEGERKNKIK